MLIQAGTPDWLTYLFQIRQIQTDWDQMRWMLEYGYAEWDWMVLTLNYHLSFLTSMYEHHYIDLMTDPQLNELVENS